MKLSIAKRQQCSKTKQRNRRIKQNCSIIKDFLEKYSLEFKDETCHFNIRNI